MIVDHKWLADHLNDKNLVIIDTRGYIPYSYAHIPNSVPLGIEKVIKMAGFQNVKLYDGSIIDWASRRLPIEY